MKDLEKVLTNYLKTSKMELELACARLETTVCLLEQLDKKEAADQIEGSLNDLRALIETLSKSEI